MARGVTHRILADWLPGEPAGGSSVIDHDRVKSDHGQASPGGLRPRAADLRGARHRAGSGYTPLDWHVLLGDLAALMAEQPAV